MERSSRVELTNICIICDKDRVLVQEKHGTGYEGGLVFPGGHVELDETIQASVIREVREETGLNIKHPKLCGLKDWMEDDGVRYLVFVYRADEFDGKLTPSKEGDLFWLKRSEMAEAKLIWHMREILEMAESDRYNEVFLNESPDGKYIPTLIG